MVWFCFFLYSRQSSAVCRTIAVMLGFRETLSGMDSRSAWCPCLVFSSSTPELHSQGLLSCNTSSITRAGRPVSHEGGQH